MTFVRRTGHLRDRCTMYACFHARSCAQPDWNVNSNSDFDDDPVDTIYAATANWKLPNECRINDVSTARRESCGRRWSFTNLYEPRTSSSGFYDGGVFLSNSCIMS